MMNQTLHKVLFCFLLLVSPSALAQENFSETDPVELLDEGMRVDEDVVADEDGELAAADSYNALPDTDKRIVELEYNERDVFTITTRYGFQTSVQFSPNEDLLSISVGDKSLWQIIPAGDRIFIRPMDEGAMTNMTVMTTYRTYQFDLKSLGASETSGNVYAVSFYYPDEIAAAQAAAQQEQEVLDQKAAKYALLSGARPPAPPVQQELPATYAAEPQPAVEAGVAYGNTPPAGAPVPFGGPTPENAAASAGAPPPRPMAGVNTSVGTVASPANVQVDTVVVESLPGGAPEPANFNYTYSGADVLAPLQVFDDGKSTYLKYAGFTGPLPDAYVLSNGGQVVTVNRTVSGEYLVVDAVVPEMILKSPAGAIHVFNETLATP